MAVKRSKSKGNDFETDSDGNVDIFVLVNDQGMSMIEAAEATELSIAEVHRLLWAQEVEHDPSLEIDANQDEKRLGRVLAEERNNGVRWERLMARSGLSKARIMELVAANNGVEPDDLKRPMGAREEDEEESEEEAKPARKTSRKTSRKAAAKTVEPDEEEESDEEEAAPAARRPRRRKARA